MAESEEQGESIRWRLQPDLQFEATAIAGRFQVRNPVSGERFELGEEEVFLCQALNRTADPQVIQVDFAQQFGLTITADQLHQFYQDMAALGLLSAMDDAPRDEADADSPEIDDDDRPGDAYRWSWFDPQRGFNWIATHLHGLRHGIWLLVPGIPLALLVLLYNQPQYQHTLKAFADPGWHLLFKLTFGLFVVNLFSKIAQGATCAFYQGRVAQFGLRLAYGFIPRFFVAKRVRDLSRRQRLWIAAAGLLAKLSLFVLGVLLWRLTFETGGTLGVYSFIVSHIALGAFLFTANPLWRADGYAWLATFLSMPRLRERAFQVLGLYLRGRRPPAGLPSGEKYALLGYAVACVTYVLLLVGIIVLAASTYLKLRFQGVGVVLILVLVTLAARWFLHRLARQRQRGAKRAMPISDKARSTPQPSIIEKKQGGLRWRLALLALLAMASFLPYSYDVTGEVTLFPTARAEIHAVTSGVVTQVQVRENEWVTPEQVLAELSTWQQDQDLAVTAAVIKRQQAELELLQHGPKAEAIEYARQQLAMAQVRAKHSRKVRELLELVHQQGVVKALEYEEAVKTAEVDQAAVTVAEANLSLIKSPPLPLEVAAKEAELEQLRAQQTYLEEQRKRTYLRTPVAGRVVTPRPEFMTGNYLKEGDLFVAVEDHRVMRAEILAPETDIGEVRADAPVQLRVWAYPLRDFTGHVTAVAPVVEPNPANPFMRAVRVIIEIPNPDGLLKSQMTGFAKIAAGEQWAIVAFTRALVRFVMLEMWSWLP